MEVNASYEYSDNTNIYLGEFDKKDFNNDNIEISTYSNDEIPKMNFKFIYSNNKLYICPEGNVSVEILTSDNEKKVYEGKKPVVELKDVEMDYELDTISSSKIPKLKFKDMWKMAKDNIAVLGKKQIFLIISFIAMAILMVLTVQDILSVTNVDEKSIVSVDSHLVQVDVSEKAQISQDEFDMYFEQLMEAVSKMDGISIEPRVSPYITYEYNAFWQLAEIKQVFSNYSAVSIDKLSEDTIIYGEMADDYNEIVIDKRVLENYLNEKTEISNIVNNIEHFVGKELILGKDAVRFKVTGICDSGENTIYMDKFTMLSTANTVEQINGLSSLVKITDGEYDDITLNEGEVLLPESVFKEKANQYLKDTYTRYYNLESELLRSDRKYRHEEPTEEERNEFIAEMEEKVMDEYGLSYAEYLELAENYTEIEFTFETAYGAVYKPVGAFSDEFDLNIVMSDSSYEQVNIEVAKRTKKFDLYLDNKEEALKELEKTVLANLPEEFLDSVNIVVTDSHTEALNDYKEAMKETFNGRIIVTASIFLVSMVILYFMMKSNAVSKITDLGVYRLLGISKKSIIGLFALESLIITTYTSLVTVILTTVVTRFLGNIPSLGLTVIYPWYACVGTIVFIYLANVIIGVSPVVKLLKLPPAALAAKYDI